MALKPWYKVITPREDLRDGRPLDASEFAVHLDHVRDGRAPDDYQKPERFFDRTFLTSSLRELGGGVFRRLSGIKVETSAVYNLTTQFGGGKTHALTLLYHLGGAPDKGPDKGQANVRMFGRRSANSPGHAGEDASGPRESSPCPFCRTSGKRSGECSAAPDGEPSRPAGCQANARALDVIADLFELAGRSARSRGCAQSPGSGRDHQQTAEHHGTGKSHHW